MARLPDGWVFIPVFESRTIINLKEMELVTCQHCKHKEESVSSYWKAWCNRLHCGVDLDWFCADGEEEDKENEGND